MGKLILSLDAVKDAVAIIRTGVQLGDKLARANATFPDRLNRHIKNLRRLMADVKMYGLNAIRLKESRELYEKYMKGKDLAAVTGAHAEAYSKKLAKCVTDEETANVEKEFKLKSTLVIETLKFFDELFEKVLIKEKAPKAKAVKAKA